MRPNQPRTWLPVGEAIFAVLMWGGSFVATKVALQEVHPLTVVWLRFALGLLVLGSAVVIRRQFRLPAPRDLALFAVVGFIGVTLHQWLQSTGMLTSQATTTSWLVATTPIFMVIAGWTFLGEKFSLPAALGVGVAGFGVLLVVGRGDIRQLTGVSGLGDFLILLSSPNWALFSMLSKRLMQKFPATLSVFYLMLFGWLFTSVLFFFAPRPAVPANPLLGTLGLYTPGLADLANLRLDGWVAILMLGILAAGLAYIAWYDALNALPLSQTGSFVYLEPFVTLITAALILGERMTLPAAAGGVLIMAGVWLVNRPRRA